MGGEMSLEQQFRGQLRPAVSVGGRDHDYQGEPQLQENLRVGKLLNRSIPADFPIRYLVAGQSARGHAQALSEDQLLFIGEKLLQVGSEIELQLALPIDDVLRLNAIVRNCHDGAMTAQFINISIPEKQCILELMYEEIMRHWH